MIITREVCRDYKEARTREWSETNGLGGYASSTILGLNTRRYHGLLVASASPQNLRRVILSKVEEVVTYNGRSYDLSTNQYPAAIHPQGFQHLQEFRLDPFPKFLFAVDDLLLEKEVGMLRHQNTVIVAYRVLKSKGEAKLFLRPLITDRSYHLINQVTQDFESYHELAPGLIRQPLLTQGESVLFCHNAGQVAKTGLWYKNFEYFREELRGLEYSEDLFQPFEISYNLMEGSAAILIASLDVPQFSAQPITIEQAEAEMAVEKQRRNEIKTSLLEPSDKFAATLDRASDQFLVRRQNSFASVIAGYHWFGEWSRDTMIALPGLALVTGRYDHAREALVSYSRVVKDGLLPNFFPENGADLDYGNADASLWYFQAVYRYLKYTGDYDILSAGVYAALQQIIDSYRRGTLHLQEGPAIFMDSDGLIWAGAKGQPLTWMDAKIGDWVITPRSGKCVEINALWYNALRIMSELAGRIEPDRVWAYNDYTVYANGVKGNFVQCFWNPQSRYLNDCVDGEEADQSLRPNQILALSLPFRLLSQEQEAGVLAAVENHLLTPLGLRSLAPSDGRYCGYYGGPPWQRDMAYHQGTVWAWLMGQYITAFVRFHGHTQQARAQAKKLLDPFVAHLEHSAVGSISEIFDGDPPFYAHGCIAQAWSVGEILRAYHEDVLGHGMTGPEKGASGE